MSNTAPMCVTDVTALLSAFQCSSPDIHFGPQHPEVEQGNPESGYGERQDSPESALASSPATFLLVASTLSRPDL